MGVSPELLVAGGGAMATLGVGIYLNRRRIFALENWAWGTGRDETDEGVAGRHESLGTQLDRVEGKIDEESERRQEDHETVEVEIRTNRRLVVDSVSNLVAELNDEVDEADLDAEDVAPEWYRYVDDDGDDEVDFFRGGGRATDGGRGDPAADDD